MNKEKSDSLLHRRNRKLDELEADYRKGITDIDRLAKKAPFAGGVSSVVFYQERAQVITSFLGGSLVDFLLAQTT